MAENEIVKLKGIKDGLVIIVSEADYTEIIKQVREKVEEVVEFFSEGEGRIIIKGYSITGINRLNLEREIMQVVPENIVIEYDENDEIATYGDLNVEDRSKFYHGTLRSGQTIKSLGNLVVVGDVNPGAELIAAGNIVVMGVLRGTVHAGCNGDREAYVSACRMAPTQIRIADIITRPPDEEMGSEWLPEIAYIHEGNIYIDGYLSKKIK